jgi:formate hydrogenlyase subunit 4
MRVKQAENYVAIFETLKAMLYKGGKYDLVESFPLVFSVQKCATKWKKISPIRAYTIHTLVAAYLYCVALMFRCTTLENHISQIMQEREKKGQLCTLVTLQKSFNPTLVLLSTSEYRYLPNTFLLVMA